MWMANTPVVLIAERKTEKKKNVCFHLPLCLKVHILQLQKRKRTWFSQGHNNLGAFECNSTVDLQHFSNPYSIHGKGLNS